ncbi:response regulator [Methanobacterium sp.]|uniref:response regulator n=1 Tax=Methanobacterium sp. TaxID=2164 RepID=UPI003C758B44
MTEYSHINIETTSILLVEDNISDARLIKEFLKEVNFNNVLYTANDGIEALHFLYMHNPTPDVIILDLNLPKMGGIEVLKEIKNDDTLKRIPVIVLTTSTAIDDIKECYDNYANCYLAKPANFTDFENIMISIKKFWFNVVKLP